MSDELILLDIQDQIAHITLNRPDTGNSMGVPFTDRLMDVVDQCVYNPDVRAILLTAKGKMFCVGGDINGFIAMGDDAAQGAARMTAGLHTAISRLNRCNAPVVAAVQGTAAGAGMSLAAACDITLAAESAKFTMAYTAAGLSPDGSSSWFLPRMIGLRRTRELMLTNRRLTAAEAEAWGLINRVVPDAQLEDEAWTLVRHLASGATAAFGSVKQLLRTSFEQGLEAQMEDESQFIARAISTADFKEGAAAFTQKRKPEFKGR